MEIPGKS